MTLTTEQIIALAPDASAAAAGRKLASTSVWQHLGRDATALWGECRGSAVYQVRADLTDLTTSCTCPSRKYPCKHGIGLLLLAANGAASIPDTEPPEWVIAWLAKRAARAEKQAVPPPVPSGAKRVEPKQDDARLIRVLAGLDALDLWLTDLIRDGLASVEAKPVSWWEVQAARMVDAQAPGIAARLRQMATLPLSAPDWPGRLLAALGKLALLTHAVRRLDALPPALAADVRGLVGWSLKREEVIATGETVTDDWCVLGLRETTEGRLRQRATWLVGATTGRDAVIFDYATGKTPFAASLPPGTTITADLAFWPSASPLRALVRERHDKAVPGPFTALPVTRSVAGHLASVTDALARQPWGDRFPCALGGVVPVRGLGGGLWHVCDAARDALPLARGDYWLLLALSGGAPVDLFGEWDGEHLAPLGVVAEGAYTPLVAGEDRAWML